MKKKILENWIHIEAIESEMKEDTGDSLAGFNRGLLFNGQRMLLIPLEHKRLQKNGLMTKKVYTRYFLANYCPFSGLPLYEEEAE
ncbi:MAG TPA: hypothetical protein PLF29_03470 [bacterium]|nr:hypothetical protein [bacterium]